MTKKQKKHGPEFVSFDNLDSEEKEELKETEKDDEVERIPLQSTVITTFDHNIAKAAMRLRDSLKGLPDEAFDVETLKTSVGLSSISNKIGSGCYSTDE